MSMRRNESNDGMRQDVVSARRPDDVGRQPVDVDRCRDNVMKRKTLRRCDNGQTSVSESFTESDTTEAGTQLLSLVTEIIIVVVYGTCSVD